MKFKNFKLYTQGKSVPLDESPKSDLKVRPVEKLLKLINGLLGVKAGRGLVHFFVKISVVVLGRRKAIYVRAAVGFAKEISRLQVTNGSGYLVKYLKACTVLLMQSGGRMKIPASQPLGCAVARTKSGYPRIIPSIFRRLIRSGNVQAMQFWLSLFSLYRVLDCPSKLKLDTITKPGVPLSVKLRKDFKRSCKSSWAYLGYKPSLENLSPLVIPTYGEIFPIRKSSPLTSSSDGISTVSSSYVTILLSIYHMAKHPDLFEAMTKLVVGWEMTYLNSLATQCLIEAVSHLEYLNSVTNSKYKGEMGKLGFKEEPAGKVRVFAMVDVWTMWVLKPLHDALFSILRRLPTDGTFDQLAPIHRLLETSELKFWCFDLSAATDRLPIRLQRDLLSCVMDEELVDAWATLLVERDYKGYHKKLCNPAKLLRYEVGQPMGALSSWAMLAITHHFIVQYAARRAGVIQYPSQWFKGYAVLGDDICLTDGRVAREYRAIMSQFGVELSAAKSLISDNRTLEFAKRYIWRGQNASPVSLRELLTACFSPSALMSFCQKWTLTLICSLDIMGYGYKVKGSIQKPFKSYSRHTKVLDQVVGYMYSKLPFIEWISMRSINSQATLDWEAMRRHRDQLNTRLLAKLERCRYTDEQLVNWIRTLIGTHFRRGLFKGFDPFNIDGPMDLWNSPQIHVFKTLYYDLFSPVITRLDENVRSLRLRVWKTFDYKILLFEDAMQMLLAVDKELTALELPRHMEYREDVDFEKLTPFRLPTLWKDWEDVRLENLALVPYTGDPMVEEEETIIYDDVNKKAYSSVVKEEHPWSHPKYANPRTTPRGYIIEDNDYVYPWRKAIKLPGDVESPGDDIPYDQPPVTPKENPKYDSLVEYFQAMQGVEETFLSFAVHKALRNFFKAFIATTVFFIILESIPWVPASVADPLSDVISPADYVTTQETFENSSNWWWILGGITMVLLIGGYMWVNPSHDPPSEPPLPLTILGESFEGPEHLITRLPRVQSEPILPMRSPMFSHGHWE